jgi:hypothetical protein
MTKKKQLPDAECLLAGMLKLGPTVGIHVNNLRAFDLDPYVLIGAPLTPARC